jgi:6-pyruvoyltetrahydropterin/6-carboxytetrahydropterin synthase
MKISVKREIQFEASHRLLNYGGKCSNIHGHNYKVWIYFRSTTDPLDSLGMVIDFNDIKNRIGAWVDENWDHSLIYHNQDIEIKEMLNNTTFKRFEMTSNPTAENMAIHLLYVGKRMYNSTSLEMFKVEVFENDKSVAIAEL